MDRYFPAQKHCECYGIIDQKIYGVMPCGDIKKFSTEAAYETAYQAELDEFIDEMARLSEENEIEFPEDYSFA